MKKIIPLLLLLPVVSSAQNVKVTAGSLTQFQNFYSKLVEPRDVDVWLPENYQKDGNQKYSVLYMHDGQMLLDADNTWNKQSWEADATAQKLQDENKTQKFIVVCIYNIGKVRHSNYFPQKPFESLSQTTKDSLYAIGDDNNKLFGENVNSDNYLKFIVTELKPLVDKSFNVYTDQQHTFIAGSSMGGLISLYAICEYPDVFGGAACLSTHWPGTFSTENNPIPKAFFDYLGKNLPSPKNHKIYFDYGDQTLDALYKPYQLKVDAIMKSKGFTAKNWITKFFPGKDHSENAWKDRLDIPLVFLLGK
ncbi:alpha/beta hydrolase [Flavobacterium sp. 3HN19-14]|uniref:alpha/beta hydrolase n=1 Tax=Flavobacterium sp. 3HN19-14 TaxID=3448133 RepID=UPI003EE3F832